MATVAAAVGTGCGSGLAGAGEARSGETAIVVGSWAEASDEEASGSGGPAMPRRVVHTMCDLCHKNQPGSYCEKLARGPCCFTDPE